MLIKHNIFYYCKYVSPDGCLVDGTSFARVRQFMKNMCEKSIKNIDIKELRNIIKNLNNKEIADFSDKHIATTYLYIYESSLKAAFYKKLLERFVNCKTPSELLKAVEELSAKKYNIPEEAVGKVADNILLDKIIESINSQGRVKIAIEENSTLPKKVATILSASIEDTKIRLLNLIDIVAGIKPNTTQVEKNNRIEKSYKYIMEEIKRTYDFLNGSNNKLL